MCWQIKTKLSIYLTFFQQENDNEQNLQSGFQANHRFVGGCFGNCSIGRQKSQCDQHSTPPPPVDNHSQLVTHRSGSLKKAFVPLCLALMGVFFVPNAQARSICHTETVNLSFCPTIKKSPKTPRTPFLKCRFRVQKIQVCRELIEPISKDYLTIEDFLDKRKGLALRDETIMVESAVFQKIQQDKNFTPIEINTNEIKTIDKGSLKIDRQVIDKQRLR